MAIQTIRESYTRHITTFIQLDSSLQDPSVVLVTRRDFVDFVATKNQRDGYFFPVLLITPRRYGHTCVSVGNAFFVFGGWNGQQAVNSVVVLELL